MTNSKYTERMFYNDLLNEEVIKSTPRYLEKVQNALDRLDKKNASRSNKLTKNQLQNIEIKSKVLEVLTEPMTVAQLTKVIEPLFPELNISPNRITSIMTDLKKSGQVVREEIKRVPYYSIA